MPEAVGAPVETSGPVTVSPEQPAADVELRQVVKRYADCVAVAGVDLEIPRGQFYSLLGPSGSGKTTCLRLIAGFAQPDEGDVRVAGASVAGVPPYRRHVNTVFQQYALFPHMDVASNVGYGLRQQRPRLPRREIEMRVGEALELVRLGDHAHRRIWELSGGQQQRIALARALINRPRVLLLDEPLGALDLKLRKAMQLELKAIQHEVGITFVYVTHDQEEALAMSDCVAVMDGGRIVQEGSPTDLYYEPRERFVAAFVGECNLFDGIVLERGPSSAVRLDSGGVLRVRAPAGGVVPGVGDRAAVGVRPEYVMVSAAEGSDGGWSGRVAELTFLGDQVEYHVETEGLGRIVARTSSAAHARGEGFEVGANVVVGIEEGTALVLADSTAARPGASEDGSSEPPQ